MPGSSSRTRDASRERRLLLPENARYGTATILALAAIPAGMAAAVLSSEGRSDLTSVDLWLGAAVTGCLFLVARLLTGEWFSPGAEEFSLDADIGGSASSEADSSFEGGGTNGSGE